MTGKMYNEGLAKSSAIFAFLSYNLTFIPQFIAGSNGMPRRYHEYLPEFTLWHQLSSIGAFLFGISLFCVLFTLIHSLLRGEKAPQNPWGGVSLEWSTATPPIEHNFHEDPICDRGPYDFDEIEIAEPTAAK